MKNLFCFGYGFVAGRLGAALAGDGWQVAGTSRQPDGTNSPDARLLPFAGGEPELETRRALAEATHLLFSIPPDEDGDPALRHLDATRLPHLDWAAYLSTTGVYGDTAGAWVDEASPLNPTGQRSRNRVSAEQQFRDWAATANVPAFVFRLAGIYGPGRSAIDRVRAGAARRVYKPGQVFSRIHVDDIVSALRAAIAHPAAAGVYNVCDDAPAAPWDVIAHAAGLCGVPAPPVAPFHRAELTPMARSFYADCRRVRNDKLKRELGVSLAFPTYREGLAAIAGVSMILPAHTPHPRRGTDARDRGAPTGGGHRP